MDQSLEPDQSTMECEWSPGAMTHSQLDLVKKLRASSSWASLRKEQEGYERNKGHRFCSSRLMAFAPASEPWTRPTP